mmetsp:Transcript_57305/g.139719  ORF Transcript_57305/g.139719 Transcript_57305/m.139719 type:complete len:430 (+) Transcript_57305:1493-2782(+)
MLLLLDASSVVPEDEPVELFVPDGVSEPKPAVPFAVSEPEEPFDPDGVSELSVVSFVPEDGSELPVPFVPAVLASSVSFVPAAVLESAVSFGLEDTSIVPEAVLEPADVPEPSAPFVPEDVPEPPSAPAVPEDAPEPPSAPAVSRVLEDESVLVTSEPKRAPSFAPSELLPTVGESELDAKPFPSLAPATELVAPPVAELLSPSTEVGLETESASALVSSAPEGVGAVSVLPSVSITLVVVEASLSIASTAVLAVTDPVAVPSSAAVAVVVVPAVTSVPVASTAVILEVPAVISVPSSAAVAVVVVVVVVVAPAETSVPGASTAVLEETAAVLSVLLCASTTPASSVTVPSSAAAVAAAAAASSVVLEVPVLDCEAAASVVAATSDPDPVSVPPTVATVESIPSVVDVVAPSAPVVASSTPVVVGTDAS